MSLDAAVVTWMATVRTPELTLFFTLLTNFVDYMILGLFLLVILLRKEKKLFYALLTGIIIDAFLVLGLKTAFGRPRPYTELPVGLFSVELSSFPSGHASRAFLVANIWGWFQKKRRFHIFLLVFAFLISFSRVYLGVHYLSDVIAGAVLGSATGYIVMKYKLGQKLEKRAKKFLKRF